MKKGGVMKKRKQQILDLFESGIENKAEIARRVRVSHQYVAEVLDVRRQRKQRKVTATKDGLLRTGEVCRLLRLHSNTVRRYADSGRLTVFRIGQRGDRRYKRSEVLALLKESGE